ncbi:MAG: helix-turn-helix domain-containing protein [Planctomycetota bacterium]
MSDLPSARVIDAPSPEYSRALADRFDRRTPRYVTTRPRGGTDYLLIYTDSGSGVYRQGSLSRCSSGGDLTLYRPGVPQDYRTARGPDNLSSTWTILWAHFHPWPHQSPLLDWPDAAPGLGVGWVQLPDLASRRRAVRLLEEAAAAGASADPRRDLIAMNAIERLLLLARQHTPDAGNTHRDPRIADALDWLHARLDQRLTVEQIARAAHLSPSRFAHLFAEQLGRPPMRYVDEQRLRRARELLTVTLEPIQRVASAVGYADPLFFSRRFKRATGHTPTAYRQRFSRPS